MVESSDQLGLVLEGPNEMRIVGHLGLDDFYRDLATNRWLERPIGSTDHIGADSLPQLITTDCQSGLAAVAGQGGCLRRE